MALTPEFDRALQFAADSHRDHLRKGTNIPYLSHLLAVAALVLEHGGDETAAIAALLHDAVEDGKASVEEIRALFGDSVAEIVVGCSDSDCEPKRPWRERKEAYLAHIAAATESIRLVSAADKLHNARAILRDYREIGEALWKRFNAGGHEILWYYRSLVTAFCAFGRSSLVDELKRVVSELERLTSSTGNGDSR